MSSVVRVAVGRPLPAVLVLGGIVSAACSLVVLLDVLTGSASARTQELGGIAMLAAGIPFTLVLLDRARRETGARHVEAYRWLAVGSVVMAFLPGLAYVVLAAAGTVAGPQVVQLALVIGFPFYAAGFLRIRPPLVGTRHERRIVAADGAVAALCFTAIFVQVGSHDADQQGLSALELLALATQALALAAVVWGVARSRHHGLLPARQLALWSLSSLVYLAAAIVVGAQGEHLDVELLLVPVALAASTWIAVPAAYGATDEVESEHAMTVRETAARVVPLLPPLLVLGVLAYDVANSIDLSKGAAALALLALAGIVATSVLLRLLNERELERSAYAASAHDLEVGTGQPWFQALVGGSSDVVTLVDLSGTVVYQTPSVSRVLGFPPGAWLGHHVRELVDPADHKVLAQALTSAAKLPDSSRTIELQLLSRQHGLRFTETTVTAVSGDVGPLAGYVLTTRDVTDRRHLRTQLEAQAETDALTGRANLTAMRRQTRESLRLSQPRQVAVMTLDLDRFSTLNDALGHGTGDELLTLAGEALVRCVRPWDLVARVGGDSFAILVMGANVERSVARIQERVRRALAGLLLSDGREITLTASAGYAVNDDGSETAEDLLRNADLAMSRARSSMGVDLLRFQSHMHEALLARVQSEQEVRAAFARGELELHHQPVYDLATRRIVGVEGLARWRHPYRGLVVAGEFVPLVEDLGLGPQLAEWVVGEAAAALAVVRASCPTDDRFRVGINLSARDLTYAMLGVIDRALEANGVRADGLVVEVTESSIATDEREARAVLQELRSRGVEVAIDDFGTGYASLAMLAAFPVDHLKIDRSFVAGMGASREGEALVVGVIGLSRALGLRPVAEGVETEEQARALLDLGCPSGQGWLFEAALPLEDLVVRLQQQHLAGTA
ncbi:MAG: EAL domain-containing protein [Candidatus Nanopelagicales bacterium]